MHGLIREEHHIKSGMGAKFVAQHLMTRTRYGKAVIVVTKPHSAISAIRKQWLKLVRKKQTERASTLDAERIRQLVEMTAYMKSRRFTLKYPPDEYIGDVYIANPETALRWPPSCQTMYVLCDMKPEQLHIITAWMPKNALVVILR
jgi:hypothetical protein